MYTRKERIGTVAERLSRAGYFMATAESCTGGLIAAACTDVAGSSAWFKGGVVAYANAVKEHVLGVPRAVLDAHGAVSEEVVRHMALGALAVCGAEASIAVSGVAGPGGGTEEKPVGTVWIAVAVRARGSKGAAVSAVRYLFDGDRSAVREQTVDAGLEDLRKLLETCA
ncbi:MAG: Nicotinamide-nucleotide amidohydrolase PncC [Desulfovibrio sp.]